MTIPDDFSPCNCPAGPCEHYPYPAVGRFADFRAGTSGLPRATEIAYLRKFVELTASSKSSAMPFLPTSRGGLAATPTWTPTAAPEGRTPSIAQQAASYTSAMATYYASGMKKVSEEVLTSRRAACDACPHRDAAQDMCRLCGCPLSGGSKFLPDKLQLPHEQCPDKPPRWLAVPVQE